MHPWAMAAMGLGTGLMIGVAAASIVRAAFAPAPKPEPVLVPESLEGDDDESILAANARLVGSLQECNRRLSDLGQKRVAQPPAAQPAPTTSNRLRGSAWLPKTPMCCATPIRNRISA
jgi:hypothetical protein